jgi:hypothetical protein
MQFMSVFTFDPAHRNEVIKRRLDLGTKALPGIKKLGEWSYLGSGRVFALFEVNDPALTLEATRVWSDLGHIDIYPVMETEKVLEAYAASMMATAVK